MSYPGRVEVPRGRTTCTCVTAMERASRCPSHRSRVASCRAINTMRGSIVSAPPVSASRCAARLGYFLLNEQTGAPATKNKAQYARISHIPNPRDVMSKLMEVDLPHPFGVDQLLFTVKGPTPNRLARSHRQEPKRRSHGSSLTGGSTRAVIPVK